MKLIWRYIGVILEKKIIFTKVDLVIKKTKYEFKENIPKAKQIITYLNVKDESELRALHVVDITQIITEVKKIIRKDSLIFQATNHYMEVKKRINLFDSKFDKKLRESIMICWDQ